MTPHVIAIIQGRMSSSRLPGKILADISGQPMLQRGFTRTSRAATVTQTLFATTRGLLHRLLLFAPRNDKIIRSRSSIGLERSMRQCR